MSEKPGHMPSQEVSKSQWEIDEAAAWKKAAEDKALEEKIIKTATAPESDWEKAEKDAWEKKTQAEKDAETTRQQDILKTATAPESDWEKAEKDAWEKKVQVEKDADEKK